MCCCRRAKQEEEREVAVCFEARSHGEVTQVAISNPQFRCRNEWGL